MTAFELTRLHHLTGALTLSLMNRRACPLRADRADRGAHQSGGLQDRNTRAVGDAAAAPIVSLASPAGARAVRERACDPAAPQGADPRTATSVRTAAPCRVAIKRPRGRRERGEARRATRRPRAQIPSSATGQPERARAGVRTLRDSAFHPHERRLHGNRAARARPPCYRWNGTSAAADDVGVSGWGGAQWARALSARRRGVSEPSPSRWSPVRDRQRGRSRGRSTRGFRSRCIPPRRGPAPRSRPSSPRAAREADSQ